MEAPEPPQRRELARAAPPAPPVPLVAPAPRVGRKERVNVSLPFELSRRLVERAEAEQRYLTDMVLEAIYTFGSDVRPRGRSRPTDRMAAGRITHMLYLTVDELQHIDVMASERGMSRSGFVAAALELLIGD